jgi:hypothetical protein
LNQVWEIAILKFRTLPLLILALAISTIVVSVSADDNSATPQGIIVKPPDPSGLTVDMELNRTRYSPGAEVEIKLDLNEKAFVYLYGIDTEGNVNLLLPNRYDRDNQLGPGEVKLPGRGYSYLASRKKGTEYLQVIASTRPLKIFSSINEEDFSNNPFPRLSENARSFGITGEKRIASEVPRSDWATSWRRIEVTEKLSEVSVFSDPPNAEIYVDDRFAGKTPNTVPVEPGNRKLTLKRSNFESWSTRFSVKPYERKRIEASLQQTEITWLRVTSNPEGADVYVDGSFQGVTPTGFFAESGERRVRVSRQGYEVWERTINVKPYLNRDLEVDLSEIRYSYLALDSTPSGAGVYVDGEYMGTTPTELELRANEKMEIVLRKDGYASWKREVVLTPNRGRNFSVNLLKPEKTDDRLSRGPEIRLGFNGGGILDNGFSLGSEIGIGNFVLGGSFRSTGNPDVPEEINWVPKTWDGGETLNYGPEWEVYLGYELPLLEGLHVRLGPGVAVQPKANLEPTDNSTGSNSSKLLFIVARNAYLMVEPNLTLHAGLGISRDNYSIDLIYHNRRGPVLSFGFNF